MVIFYSYVKLPEGKKNEDTPFCHTENHSESAVAQTVFAVEHITAVILLSKQVYINHCRDNTPKFRNFNV